MGNISEPIKSNRGIEERSSWTSISSPSLSFSSYRMYFTRVVSLNTLPAGLFLLSGMLLSIDNLLHEDFWVVVCSWTSHPSLSSPT